MATWVPRFGLAVVAGMAFSGTMTAQSPLAASSSSPRLVLAQEEHDFGTISPTSGPRVAQLQIRNTGEQALRVRNIRTSCLCLRVEPREMTLAPRSEAVLRIEIDPSRVEELFTESVLIYSNDPEAPLSKINVTGNTSQPIRLFPIAIPVGVSYRGDLPRVPFPPVHLSSADGQPLGTARATASHPAIHPALRKLEDGGYEVSIKIDDTFPLGQVSETVKVETQHPKTPIVEVPVLGAVVGELTPVGRLVDFAYVPEGEPASATLALPKRGTGTITVLRAVGKLPVPSEVDAKLNAEGTHMLITVRVPQTPAFTLLRGYVELETDNPLEPLVRVQVAGGVYAKKPFDRAGRADTDAAFLALVADALARGDNLPVERFFSQILGGVQDGRVIPLLMKSLTDGSLPTRMRAVEFLGGFRTPEVIERLRVTLTEDPEEFVRRNALVAYAEIVGAAAVPELLMALQDDYAWVREDAAAYLGRLGDARAIPALRAALGDPDPDANEAVRTALAALKSKTK